MEKQVKDGSYREIWSEAGALRPSACPYCGCFDRAMVVHRDEDFFLLVDSVHLHPFGQIQIPQENVKSQKRALRMGGAL